RRGLGRPFLGGRLAGAPAACVRGDRGRDGPSLRAALRAAGREARGVAPARYQAPGREGRTPGAARVLGGLGGGDAFMGFAGSPAGPSPPLDQALDRFGPAPLTAPACTASPASPTRGRRPPCSLPSGCRAP